jgi:tape measure domain-containing protein
VANTDVKIQITVGGSEDAVRKIKSVDDAIGGTSGSGGLVKSFTLGNLAANAITTSVRLATEALRAVGSAIVDTAQQSLVMAGKFQQTAVSFEALIGNAELSKKTLMELRDFSLATPFGFEEITDASKRLLAYGVAAEELIPTMDMLGNITAAVGTEKMPQLILAYGQVRAATRLTGMELRQFTETGVPMLAALAESMNVPISSIQEMVSEGKVGFTDVRKALELLTAEGGKYDDLMQKQSKTMYGVNEKLSDMVKMFMGIVGGVGVDLETIPGGLLDVIVTKGNEILDWILEHKDEIVNFLTDVTTRLGTLINDLVTWGGNVATDLSEIKKGIDESGVDDSLKGLTDSFNDLTTATDSFGTEYDGIDWDNANENIGLSIAFLMKLGIWIARATVAWWKGLSVIAAGLYLVGQKALEANYKVLEFIATLTGGKLNEASQKAYDKLKKDITNNEKYIKETLKSIDKDVTDITADALESLTGLPFKAEVAGSGMMLNLYNEIKKKKGEIQRELNDSITPKTTTELLGHTDKVAADITATFNEGIKDELKQYDPLLPITPTPATIESAKNAGKGSGQAIGDGMRIGIGSMGNAILGEVNKVLSSIKITVKKGEGSSVGIKAHYAMGGIVPGTSFSGDKVLIGANSGEMMLNKDQQSGLFNFLRSLSSAPRNINFGNVTFGGGERSVLQEQNMFMNLLVNAV